MLEKPLVWLIRGYQMGISRFIPPRCKYYPSCSAYFIEALKIHGIAKGTILGIWRLLRCNPWSYGGVDYPPHRHHWKKRSYYQMSDRELRQHWQRIDKENKENQ